MHLLYSYQFGYEVCRKFTEKLSRGTENFCKIYGISRQRLECRLIYLIRLDDQTKWRAIKRVIKGFDSEDFRDYKGLSYENRKEYLTLVLYNAELDEKEANPMQYRLDKEKGNLIKS